MNTSMKELLTETEAHILRALRRLEDGYEPQPGGGFDPDNISDHLAPADGEPLDAEQIEALLQELQERGFVRGLDAPMSAAWPSHWLLTAKGKGAAV